MRALVRNKLQHPAILLLAVGSFSACGLEPTEPPPTVHIEIEGLLTCGPDSVPMVGVVVERWAMNIGISGSAGDPERILGQDTTDNSGRFRIDYTVRKTGQYCFNYHWWETSIGGFGQWFLEGGEIVSSTIPRECESGLFDIHLHLPDCDPDV